MIIRESKPESLIDIDFWCPRSTSAQCDAVSGVISRLDAVTMECRHGNDRPLSAECGSQGPG